MQATVVGKYRIDRRLGTGGMGSVYAGIDTETGRKVAIKSVATSHDVELTRALLLREADVLRRVAARHSAFVEVYDVVVVAASELYLVREFVEGTELADWQRARAAREIVAMYANIADALAALHASDVAFRDLKPSNVLIDHAGNPRLVDFGLAVKLDRPDTLTSTGTLVGTPLYLSPEALRGSPVFGSSDVYALGVMLLEALIGRHPRADVAQASLAEFALDVVTKPPSAALEQLRHGSAGSLEPLVAEMLAVAPEQRPSARSVASSLRAWFRGDELTLPDLPQAMAAPAESLGPRERTADSPRALGLPWILVGIVCALAGGWLAVAEAGWAIVLWALAFGAAAFGFVLLLERYRRLQRQRRSTLREALTLRQRIGALEQRVSGSDRVTRSMVIGAEQIKSSFDDAELERVLRRSLIVQLADTSNMDPARLLLALHYLSNSPSARDKPSLVARVTPWMSLVGTGVAAVVAGTGFLHSVKLLSFDEPPKIRSLQPLAAKVALGGEIDLVTDAEDPEHQPLSYEYHASAGTIRGESKLATLRVPDALETRSIAVFVVVRDPAGHVATEELAVRINRRPSGKLTFSPEPTPGVLTRVQAVAADGDGDALQFQWFAQPGVVRKEADGIVYWQLPPLPGVYEIGCQVSDGLETLELRRRFERQ